MLVIYLYGKEVFSMLRNFFEVSVLFNIFILLRALGQFAVGKFAVGTVRRKKLKRKEKPNLTNLT